MNDKQSLLHRIGMMMSILLQSIKEPIILILSSTLFLSAKLVHEVLLL